MKKLFVFAIAAGSLAVACTPPTTINLQPGGGGEGGTTTNTGEGGDETVTTGETTETETIGQPTAYDVYADEVHDSLVQTCVACHNQDNQLGALVFIDSDVAYSYTLITSHSSIMTEPAQSLLITQLPHTGPALSDSQKEVVGKWLAMELEEAGGGGTGGEGGGTGTGTGTETTQTLEGMLDEFAACMDYDLWEAAGMDLLPTQQTNGEGPCLSCHNTGTGALWLSSDPLETFEKNKIFPYIMRLVTPIYEGSTPVDLAPSQRIFNKGKEICANPPVCHPKYELTPANKQALETFVSTTLTKWQSGGCDKP